MLAHNDPSMLLARDRQGNTPLHSAVHDDSSLVVVHTLVKLGGRAEVLLARRDSTDCASVLMTALLRIGERLQQSKSNRDRANVLLESRPLVEYLSHSMPQNLPTCVPAARKDTCNEQIDNDHFALVEYDHIVLAAVKLNDAEMLGRLLDTNARARSQVGTALNGAARCF